MTKVDELLFKLKMYLDEVGRLALKEESEETDKEWEMLDSIVEETIEELQHYNYDLVNFFDLIIEWISQFYGVVDEDE